MVILVQFAALMHGFPRKDFLIYSTEYIERFHYICTQGAGLPR